MFQQYHSTANTAYHNQNTNNISYHSKHRQHNLR